MWMCFAFDLEDDAVRLFWIKILQEMWAQFSLLSIFYYFGQLSMDTSGIRKKGLS